MTTVRAAMKVHPLAGIVLRQLGGGKEAVETAIDAGKHGADAGWPGFTWYSDTVPWAKRHKRAILAAARDMAIEIGDGGVFRMVAGFNCLKDTGEAAVEAVLIGTSKDEDDQTAVWNALAWFALEAVGRALEPDA